MNYIDEVKREYLRQRMVLSHSSMSCGRRERQDRNITGSVCTTMSTAAVLGQIGDGKWQKDQALLPLPPRAESLVQ